MIESEVLNERYRIIETVGTGGMATVYRGHDVLLDRPVAIKALREPYASDPAFRDRFLEEARAAARLDHPNVVQIYDVGIDQQQPYLVMEMVEGNDLKSLILQRAPLSIPEALDIVQQISAGVGSAHRAGLVHCDIKPQNVLVSPKGLVKVTDFGIARAFQEEPTPQKKEQVVWGSPHYLSPEQIQGKQPKPASDVYSIGIIMYEMLTGVPPFHDTDTTALLTKHLEEAPAPPETLNPRIPPKLGRLVNKVLSKDKAGRYRNADQLRIALEEYVKENQEMTVPQPVTPAPPSRPQPDTTGEDESAREQTANVVENADSGPDWLLWVLWGIAALAVLGLIPMWAYVYRVYNAATPPPPTTTVATATVTPAGETVSVPNLVGLNVDDAERLAKGYDLQFNVRSEIEDTDALPGTVLQQEPQPGARVIVSSTVSVIKAVGRAFTLQDVVGQDLEQVRRPLEDQGLLLHVEDVWSTEPKGKILEQQPEGGSEIRTGTTLTLTVSGGTERRRALQVNLDNRIVLEEALITQQSFQPGDSVPVTLYWRALTSIERSYKVFVHLIPEGGTALIAQHDSEPSNGTNPTNTWETGDITIDPHQVTIPQGTAAGTYTVWVGLYTSDGRLPVTDSGETQARDNSIFIAEIEIRP